MPPATISIRISPGSSFPNYQDLRGGDLPVDLAAMQMATLTCRWRGNVTTVSAHVVGGNFFDVAGIQPLFAVVSRAAARRTFEIAIRVAIGAPHSSIVGLIIRDALRTIALGCFIGVVLAFGLARVVQSVITTQSLVDPVAFALALLVLVTIGIGASLQPALWAGRTDPIKALRAE